MEHAIIPANLCQSFLPVELHARVAIVTEVVFYASKIV